MPGYRIFCILFSLSSATLFAQDPERFVDRPVASFGSSPVETSRIPQRSQSQLTGFRDALTATKPLLSVPSASTRPEAQPLPEPVATKAETKNVRQVALSEPLETVSSSITVVEQPAKKADNEFHSANTGSTDDESFDLDKPVSFGMTEKKDGGKMEKPELSKAIAPVISVIGSLLIVLSAFFILMMMFRKMSPKGNRLLPKEAFENLGRSFLTPKLQLHLLRLGNRLILVSVTADGVTPVTEVTDPDEVVPLLGMCRALDANSSTALFQKMYANMTDDDDASPPPQNAGSKKAAAKKKGNSSSLVDLYSEPDASLADLLRGGVGAR